MFFCGWVGNRTSPINRLAQNEPMLFKSHEKRKIISKNNNIYTKMTSKIIKILSICCFVWSCDAQQSKLERPNIILILADDLGYGDLGCYGSKRIETPNIDKMASEGMRFTQFYAGSAVCTPTRVSVLTGNYPIRYSVSQHFNDREMFLNNNMLTIPKTLKKQGYISKHIGNGILED